MGRGVVRTHDRACRRGQAIVVGHRPHEYAGIEYCENLSGGVRGRRRGMFLLPVGLFRRADCCVSQRWRRHQDILRTFMHSPTRKTSPKPTPFHVRTYIIHAYIHMHTDVHLYIRICIHVMHKNK